MILFELLFVILAICGNSYSLTSDPSRYAESLKEIKELEKIYTDVILSMAKDIPHLNDYRRHYSEIIHTINYVATVLAYNCSVTNRVGLYDRLLEESVTEAVTNVTHVVELTKQFLDDLNAETDTIQKLINTKCTKETTEADCNEIIHKFVLNDPEKYSKGANLLLSARESAKAFNRNSENFKKLSEEMEAHKYVLTQPIELKNVVDEFIKFIPVLYPNDSLCSRYV